MSAAAKPIRAREPFTPRGVAAFARAGWGRILLVQGVMALLAAGSIVWFIASNCFPVIGTAIQKLPPTGEIYSGRLDWLEPAPELLAEGRFLALDVDPNHSNQINPASDVQIEFGRRTVRVSSLFGYTDWPYPRRYVIAFNRNELDPLWGAWKVEFLIIAGAGSVVGLLLSWWLLAAVYIPPTWLLGLFMNRDLNFRQSWRLAGAALMPGALLMTAGTVCYGIGFWNLVSFGFAFVAHILIGWIYVFLGLLFLPRVPVQKSNPFAPVSPSRNPFRLRRRDRD